VNRGSAAAVALAAFGVCVSIGDAVSHRPPGGLDRAGAALAGEWPHVALVFTASCWWYVLVALGLAAIAFAVAVPAWRARVAFSVLTTIVAWQASDELKNVFGRPRPGYWILHQETSTSYPSGHAMFAVVVFGLWSWFVATSALPQPLRGALSAAIGLWGAAVIWSRLALGAHYVSDLTGGVLFGIAMLALATAIAPQATRAPASVDQGRRAPRHPELVEGQR
jgi:membrane-associated phospholipid phosphatase